MELCSRLGHACEAVNWSGKETHLSGGGLSGGGLEVGGGLSGGELKAGGGLQKKARSTKPSSCSLSKSIIKLCIRQSHAHEALVWSCKEHTCQVVGYQEVDLRLVAGCMQRHGQRKHHHAWECAVRGSIIKLCVKLGNVSNEAPSWQGIAPNRRRTIWRWA